MADAHSRPFLIDYSKTEAKTASNKTIRQLSQVRMEDLNDCDRLAKMPLYEAGIPSSRRGSHSSPKEPRETMQSFSPS